MNQRIAESKSGNYQSRILPFLWLHGEPQERIREEILAIKNSGVRAFCAESRPYEAFCEAQWWEDFAFILKTAKELDMTVWLLDDKKFPTGYANGYLEAPERAELRKVQIRERQSEAVGPAKRRKLAVGDWLSSGHGEEIISVIAYRYQNREETLDFESAINLTDRIENGVIYWDIPEGDWRICTTIRTDSGFSKEDRFAYYIDMLNPESTKAMIDAVYQPHYERFSEYFGNTFRGFFSDEPGFLNWINTYFNKLGTMHVPFPWCADLPELIAQSAGLPVEAVQNAIPALWEDLGDMTATVRMHYMEVVSKLYRENFSMLLGNWCREHGVAYIGHVIEDLNAHQRLGYGAGHFFRALDGQDMAGMDIVLMQDLPGVTDHVHRAMLADCGYARPEFFHYTLPKMTASHSHLQALKQGRAMCEIFGAFGWTAGLPFMKQMADHMLVSGINHFVPHAFSPKENDPDCPPHFYNGGKNVQYPLFGQLMAYMERTAHILCGATHQASVAVFYNAEGEWCGGRYESFEFTCANLTRGLIDFDIVPYDMLESAQIKENKLIINGESFEALIVSESEILPYDRLECFARLSKAGLPVIFTNRLPMRSAEGKPIDLLKKQFVSVATEDLGEYLRTQEIYEIAPLQGECEHLRFYHVKQESDSIYMFYNDAITKTLDVSLQLPESGDFLAYDAWGNQYFRGHTEDCVLRLRLEGGNALLIAFTTEIPEDIPPLQYETDRKMLNLQFEIAIRPVGAEAFVLYREKSGCVDISAPGEIEDFCGEIRYRTTFLAEAGYPVLDLGEVGETAEVFLNGTPVGVRINAPYKFDISGAYTDRENTLEILVRSNPAHGKHDEFM
ncbi:MAG: hypothetical protein E7397_03065, partial [Ruminococcaceae bacterium]|nr:hypothetical protein [Oscillospiraceae bacterium]